MSRLLKPNQLLVFTHLSPFTFKPNITLAHTHTRTNAQHYYILYSTLPPSPLGVHCVPLSHIFNLDFFIFFVAPDSTRVWSTSGPFYSHSSHLQRHGWKIPRWSWRKQLQKMCVIQPLFGPSQFFQFVSSFLVLLFVDRNCKFFLTTYRLTHMLTPFLLPLITRRYCRDVLRRQRRDQLQAMYCWQIPGQFTANQVQRLPQGEVRKFSGIKRLQGLQCRPVPEHHR